MNKPELYKNVNAMQRRDVKHTIREYAHVLQWREKGGDSILDVGCLSGDAMMDFLLPILPENFERLVGVDRSEEMIEFARRNYSHPKVTFSKFDVGIDINQQSFFTPEPFDHITSFYCLNWVLDQECAVRNLYSLLNPGGDMLIAFLAKNRVYDIYKLLSQSERWAEYMTDVDDFISPYHFCDDPVDKFEKLLASAGFSKHKVELYEISYIFEGIETLRNAQIAVNPFFDRIPTQDQGAYFDDYIKHVVDMGLALNEVESGCKTCKFSSPYSYAIAHAIK